MGWYYVKKYNLELQSRENMTNFAAPNNIANSLGQIFKRKEQNLNEYPNIDIKPGEKLFDNNKLFLLRDPVIDIKKINILKKLN